MAGKVHVQELLDDYNLTETNLYFRVTQELLVHLTKKIGNWRHIAPYLELTEVREEDIAENESKRSNEQQTLRMFQTWSQKLGSQASFLKLVEIFLLVGRKDLAEEVCDFFNKGVFLLY